MCIVEFTCLTTAQRAIKQALASGVQWQSTDTACAISSASGKRQPSVTTQIRICRPTNFALDLSTGSGNLSEVNKINTLIGHCTCAARENSAYSAGSQQRCAAGQAEVDAHLSGTDSGAAHVNTSASSLSSTTCRAPLLLQCKSAILGL